MLVDRLALRSGNWLAAKMAEQKVDLKAFQLVIQKAVMKVEQMGP
jgi:hypothetical protein